MSVMVSSDFVCFDEAVLDLPDLPGEMFQVSCWENAELALWVHPQLDGDKLQGGLTWSRTLELDPEDKNLVVWVTGWGRCVKPRMHCSCAAARVKVSAIKMVARTKQAVSVVRGVDSRNRQVLGGEKGYCGWKRFLT